MKGFRVILSQIDIANKQSRPTNEHAEEEYPAVYPGGQLAEITMTASDCAAVIAKDFGREQSQKNAGDKQENRQSASFAKNVVEVERGLSLLFTHQISFRIKILE